MIHAAIPRPVAPRSLGRRLRAINAAAPLLVLCGLLCHCGASDERGLFGGDGSAPSPDDPAPPPARAPAPAAPSPVGVPEGPAVQASADPVTPVSPSSPNAAGDSPAAGAPTNAPAPAVDPAEPDPTPAAPEPDEPDDVSAITIERARWDEGDAVLEVRGEVSSREVTLTVRFLDRSETITNDRGEFRAEFEDVEDDPGRLQVVASDGATATVDVEEN
jgi:hypothetical protein